MYVCMCFYIYVCASVIYDRVRSIARSRYSLLRNYIYIYMPFGFQRVALINMTDHSLAFSQRTWLEINVCFIWVYLNFWLQFFISQMLLFFQKHFKVHMFIVNVEMTPLAWLVCINADFASARPECANHKRANRKATQLYVFELFYFWHKCVQYNNLGDKKMMKNNRRIILQLPTLGVCLIGRVFVESMRMIERMGEREWELKTIRGWGGGADERKKERKKGRENK